MEFSAWYYWDWMLLYWRDKCLWIEQKTEQTLEVSCRYTPLGKHPLLHPSPKPPSDTTTPTPGAHTLPAPQNNQLRQKVIWASCSTEFPVSLQCLLYLIPSPSFPQDTSSVKWASHFHLEPKQEESTAGWTRKSHHKAGIKSHLLSQMQI